MQLKSSFLTRGSRGQAVFETALFMPLFLLGFFGVIFAVSYATLSERVQFGVRYGGAIANLQNPYQSYSLYSMYDAIDGGKSSDPAKCGGAVPDTNQVTSTTRGAIWRVKPGDPVPTCAGALDEFAFTHDAQQPMLVENSLMTLTASTPLSGFMSAKVFGGASSTTTSAQGNFFRSPDVGSVVTCTALASAVKASLEAPRDAGSTSAPATAIPAGTTANSELANPQVCSTFIPQDQLALVTAPPLVSTTPTATPVPPPPACPPGDTGVYPACVAPPTAPPTCPSGYTGTYPNCSSPAPTACPAGYTGTPGNCSSPSPTPTPKPTMCPSGYTGTAPSCVPPPTKAPTNPPPTMTPTNPPPTNTPVATMTPVPSTPTPKPTATPTIAPTITPQPVPSERS